MQLHGNWGLLLLLINQISELDKLVDCHLVILNPLNIYLLVRTIKHRLPLMQFYLQQCFSTEGPGAPSGL